MRRPVSIPIKRGGWLFILIALFSIISVLPKEKRLHASIHPPLFFVPNQGDKQQQVRFSLPGKESTILFLDNRILYTSPTTIIEQRFLGAASQVVLRGTQKAAGSLHSFIGNNPEKWKTEIPVYHEIAYQGIYPGIDLHFSGNKGELKSEYRVAPGADYRKILIAYREIDEAKLSDEGHLIIKTKNGLLTEQRPLVYQEIGGEKRTVTSRYVISGNQVSFELGPFDPQITIVIDPSLIYSTYLGGTSADLGAAIAIDPAGNAYITGQTFSGDLTIPDGSTPFDPTLNTGIPSTASDAYVAKINADGSDFAYITYFGGSNWDNGNAIAVDTAGYSYVTGSTDSDDFPTVNPYQASKSGSRDAFVLQLSPSGSFVLFSTYLGGSRQETGNGIALNGKKIYAIGETSSEDFPMVGSPFQKLLAGGQDAFVALFDTPGPTLVASTYLGAPGNDIGNAIALDPWGNVYAVGETGSEGFPTTPGSLQTSDPDPTSADAFITKLNPSLSILAYSSYLGGTGYDAARDVKVHPSGTALITGLTSSTNFPVFSASQATYGGGLKDAFVTKLNPLGSAFVFSTYLGGSGEDFGNAIDTDFTGNVYVTGGTKSTDFPTRYPLYSSLQGVEDAFVTKITPDGSSLLCSTYFGGTLDTPPSNPWIAGDYGVGIAVDTNSFIYLVGSTAATNLPTASPSTGAAQPTFAGNRDAFIAKIDCSLPSVGIPWYRELFEKVFDPSGPKWF